MNKLRRKALTNASETLNKPIELLTDLHDSNVTTGSNEDYIVLIKNILSIDINDINYITDTIDAFYTDVDMLCDEERDYMDNMPENLQNSERYYTAEECVNLMEEIVDCQTDALNNLNMFCGSRNDIIKIIKEITKSESINIYIIDSVFDTYNDNKKENKILNEKMDKVCELLEDVASYILETISMLEDAQDTIDDVVML